MRMPNGFGSVIKLSGKRRKPWGVRVTVTWEEDKQVRKYIGYYPTKMEALQALSEYNANPYDVDTKRMTFQQVWEHWKRSEYEEGSKAAQSAWRAGYSHCKPIYEMRIIDIKYMHLKDLLEGKGPSTQSQIKGICSKLFKYSIKNEWTDKNPALHLEVKNKSEVKRPKVIFSDEEIKDIWAKAKEDDFYEMVLILLYTGMRIMELLEIKEENVYEDYMIGGNKTAAGIGRIIPLHKKIRKFIKKRLSGSKYLITDKEGEAMDYHKFQRQFAQRIEGHVIHETRHTFVSRLHSAGVNEITIKLIVGHSQKDVTSKVYIHKMKDELLEAVHKLT